MPIKIYIPRKYSISWELADIDVPLTCVLYILVSVQCFSSDGFIMLDSSFYIGHNSINIMFILAFWFHIRWLYNFCYFVFIGHTSVGLKFTVRHFCHGWFPIFVGLMTFWIIFWFSVIDNFLNIVIIRNIKIKFNIFEIILCFLGSLFVTSVITIL